MSPQPTSFSTLTLRAGAALAGVIALGIAACGGGSSAGTDAGATGTLRLSLTDAPACGYDNVWVTVEKVRVHASATAADSDGGWSEVVLATPQRIDLLTLTNGTLQPLGQTALPAGKYTQMRLVLGSAPPAGWPAGTLANAIKPTGSSAEVALTTPSALQSGLKMNIDIDVAADKVADFAIDFDACKSFVKAGNSGQYLLKPVLSVIPILSDAGQRIVGYVDTPMAGASVSAQQNGVPMRSTTADATGKFVLYPVLPGNYDLVVNASGRVIAVMTGVPVVTTGYTDVNTTANRIAPPISMMREVAGSLTSTPVIDAVVKATKVLTGGPSVEVAARTVMTPGAYSFALPVGAAVKAAYVAAPALPAAFVADAAVPTGLYTLGASSGTLVRPPVVVDTTTAVPPTTVFAFP
ncbi:MAG: DUF4382 domain-containing protein [Burkholderiaceae bacterium]